MSILISSGIGVTNRSITKTTTFTGASGLGLHGTGTNLFVVTGLINCVFIGGRATVNCTGTGTLSLGVTGSLAKFIGTTTATNLVTTTEIWVSTTPTANALAFPAAVTNIALGDTTVIMQSNDAANDVTAGAVEITMLWQPLTPSATVV
jgi:hypothetical protein